MRATDVKVSANAIQRGKDVGQGDQGVRSDVVNNQIPLHDLQRRKIRESSNRSADGEVARNSRKVRHIARHLGIGADGEVSALIRARGVIDFAEIITSCGIANEGGGAGDYGPNGAIGDARQAATRRKHGIIH